jgi:hypothetical protein
MRSIALPSLLSLVLASSACSATLMTGDADGIPANGVELLATVQSRTSSGDSVTIRFTNSATRTAFMSRCGEGPLILVQTFVGGQWTGGVQNFACVTPAAPGPVRLEPGESLVAARILSEPGRYRFRTPVGNLEDLSDVTQAASNAVDIP